MMKATAVILIICCSLPVFAQNKSQPDSLKFYKNVEKVAKKKKSTYWLYKEIFNLPDKKKKKEKIRKQVSYQSLRGRIIRNINILTVEPFGYDIQDTSKKPTGFVQNSLNFLHQKSTKATILNQLLYKSGDSLDPLVVKESERILRSAPQIREITTLIVPLKGTDSVDVYVRVHDFWSKSFGISYSPQLYLFRFTDKNFLGLAHLFTNEFTYHPLERKYVTSGTYSMPYINRNLIVPTLYYSSDPDNFFRGVSVSRPFITPLFKWAGSVQLYDVKSSGTFTLPEGGLIDFGTRFFIRDFWLGHSFSLASDTAEEFRVTKLIVGARLNITTFNYHAPEIVASGHFYENTNLYLFNIGVTNRTYYRDSFIYRFGVQEDVPAGRILNLVNGYEKRPSGDRWYTGLEAGSGNHFDEFGYLTLRTSFGTFIRKGSLEQTVFNLGMGYFSDLLEIKRTRVRQFARLSVTYGFNRIRGEVLRLNEEIRGLESDILTGKKKASLGLQTQAYLPYSFLGFRFAPFVFADFGLIADEGKSFLKSKLYQGYGFGMLIRNELLVINTFQFAIGFYPFVPDKAGGMFRINPVKTYDFAFSDFEIGAPSVIPLQ